MTDLFLIVLGYVVGSIPFAFLLARRRDHIDIRMVGSGNVGAANVLRAVGSGVAAAVAILDVAKGAGIVWVALGTGADDLVCTAAGIAAILGHVYPPWLHFRGGKGVATSCGVFAVLAPWATAAAATILVGTVWLTRYVSVGSMAATVALPPVAYLTGAPWPTVLGAGLVSAVVISRHRSNIVRLRAGGERRIGDPAGAITQDSRTGGSN
jgi:acyl phosphate:glycerol-3-phosphate acyltransferase